jgi:hypothetical protein
MTTGAPFLYSECSNSFVEKGICHVNKCIRFSKSDPDSSRACHWADYHFESHRNYWFRLDTNRPRYRTSGFEVNGSALDTVHLPVSSYLGSPVYLMLFIQTTPEGEFNE